jgi:cyanophycinase
VTSDDHSSKGGSRQRSRAVSDPTPNPPGPHAIPAPGPVMIIGGAEDKLRDRVILNRFVQYAGGANGHIVVVSTASSLGDRATELYRLLFTEMGATRITGLRPVTRQEANDPDIGDDLADATGVFLTGGNQLRLASIVAGTVLGRAIMASNLRGAVVGGTSAGASAISTHMMAFGASGETPKHRMAQVSAGLGLLQNVIVDQHFEQRSRIGRLLAVVAQSPSLLGIGLDEDTAAIVHPDHTMEVVGRGVVTVVDGSDAVTDSYISRGHKPMLVSGVVLHSLPAGARFDLAARALLPPVDMLGQRRRRSAQATQAGAKERRALSRAAAAKQFERLVKEMAVEGAEGSAFERRRGRRQEREASE